MKKNLLVLLMLSAVIALSAQGKLSTQTRSLLLEQKNDGGVVDAKNRKFALKNVNGVQNVHLYIHFNGEIDEKAIEELGVVVTSRFEKQGIVTAQVPVDVIDELSELPSVKYIEAGRSVRKKMNNARESANVNKVHNGVAPLTKAYNGKDVIVAVVDGGFQYDHINFYDADGNHRVKKVWAQNDNSGTPPEGYTEGTEYNTQAEMESAHYDGSDDWGGHATHVMGIAAGSDRNNYNPYYGIANEADLVMVSLDGASDVLLMNSINYVFDYADEVGKPCVINYSLGTHIGPHDGTSTFDRLADEMQGEGKIMVGAAGNEGDLPLHISKEADAANDTLKSFLYLWPWDYYSELCIWGDEGENIEVQFSVYNDREGYMYESEVFSTNDNDDGIITNFNQGSQLTGKIFIVCEKENANNDKPNVLMYVELSDVPRRGETYIDMKIISKGGVHAWADGYYSDFNDLGEAGYVAGDMDYTIGEIGGTGKRMITAGAYITNDRGVGAGNGKLADFSSLGPTADGRVKPDITAPGSYIASSIPAEVKDEYIADGALTNTVNGEKYYYVYAQGTSMATPFVVGVLATWMEACPSLTPEKAREVFASTSMVDEYTGNDIPNNTWGEGKIDAFAGLVYLVGAMSTEDVEEDVLVAYPNPTWGEVNVGFVKDDENVRIDVYGVDGRLVHTEVIGEVMAGSTKLISLDGLESGAYVVKMKGDRISQTVRLMVR